MAQANGHSGQVTVLLVDEQAIIAERVRQMLAPDADIAFHTCVDPAQALARARELRPTVILQDLVMPGIDGFTLLRFYRAAPELATIPVVVLSSKEDPRDKSKAFELGASDYLVKLPDRIELVARIRSHSRSYLAHTERDAALKQLGDTLRKLEESNQELARLSRLDGLTGLPNRRVFDETLEHEWRRLARERAPLALVLLDVDFFKKYNDSHGHVSGDECLRNVASAIGRCARRPADVSARYGGEEFAVVLPNTHAEGACHVAERIRAEVERLGLVHDGRGDGAGIVTVSAGVACVIPAASSPRVHLIETADAGLYEAKRTGRNRVHMLRGDPKSD